jgi:hypothetical protein
MKQVATHNHAVHPQSCSTEMLKFGTPLLSLGLLLQEDLLATWVNAKQLKQLVLGVTLSAISICLRSLGFRF